MRNVVTHNSRTDRRRGFKLGGNYQRGGRHLWHTFWVSGSNKPKVEIWRNSAYKMQKSTKNVAKSPTFCALTGNLGRRIERRCLNLHRKFINNRFCACAVQMLLKMAVNATICSNFEVKYRKSTSTRTTAIRHLQHL